MSTNGGGLLTPEMSDSERVGLILASATSIPVQEAMPDARARHERLEAALKRFKIWALAHDLGDSVKFCHAYMTKYKTGNGRTTISNPFNFQLHPSCPAGIIVLLLNKRYYTIDISGWGKFGDGAFDELWRDRRTTDG